MNMVVLISYFIYGILLLVKNNNNVNVLSVCVCAGGYTPEVLVDVNVCFIMGKLMN